MHWYPISVSLLLVASWPSAIEASEDSATQWNYDQIAGYLAETATEENGEVFLEAIYNFFKGLTSSNNDRRQLRSNNLASPTVTQVGQTGNKPHFRTPKRTRKTSSADDTRRGLRSLQQQNSFTCTPPEIMGQCTAPDPNNVIDECSDLGEPCLDGYEGEYCCLDLCGRKYCTAKGGSRWGPAVVQEMTMNDHEFSDGAIVLDIMTMVTETDTPTNSPTTELETEDLFEVPVSSPTENEEESPTTSSTTRAPTSAPTYIMDDVTVAGEIKSTTIKCTDTPDWSDSFGDTCSYYKTPAICSTEGNDGDRGEGVAIANCCSCGGGMITDTGVATEVMTITVATEPSVIVNDDDDDDDDVFGFPLFTDDTIPAAEFQLEVVKQQLSDSPVSISTQMESHTVEDEDI